MDNFVWGPLLIQFGVAKNPSEQEMFIVTR